MNYKDELKAFKPRVGNLHEATGETATAFRALVKSIKAETALSYKEKELVALGISVALRCEPCIMFHTEALINSGATREEIADVLAVGVELCGGPGVMYGAKALQCFDDLSA